MQRYNLFHSPLKVFRVLFVAKQRNDYFCN